MARYRIGNDMTILWSITNKDGSPFPLAGKEVHLYYTCERGRYEAAIEIQNNVVSWEFLASRQKALGGYTLTLEVLQSDGKRALKRDLCDAFVLVGKNCEEKFDHDGAHIEEGGIVNLVTSLEVYRVSPIIPYVVRDENGIGYWYVDGVNTGDRSTGESAYEYAKKKGYEGAEDEFAELQAGIPTLKIKFTNPVGPHCPDPCFWKADDGYFYIKGTGRIAKVLRTRDFVHYENTGKTFISDSALEWLNNTYGNNSNDTNQLLVPHCWAPFVIKIGNNWILYMAVVERSGEYNNPVDGAAHIVAFISKTPYGDFTDPITIVSDGDYKLTNSVYWNNVIDPFVYCNPEDQKLYLVAGSSYSIGRVELSNDGLSTVLEKKVGNKCVRIAGLTISSDPTRESVYEGAYIYSRPYDGQMYHYLFASKGHYAENNYGLIVGRCENLNAIPGNPDAWSDKFGTSLITKITDPARRVILRGNSRYSGKPWGPGHCAGIFETADGRTWMLYHCHTKDGINDRQLFIQEVLWDNDGWPYFERENPVESGQILNHVITDTPKIENNTLETRIQHLEYIISQITIQE